MMAAEDGSDITRLGLAPMGAVSGGGPGTARFPFHGKQRVPILSAGPPPVASVSHLSDTPPDGLSGGLFGIAVGGDPPGSGSPSYCSGTRNITAPGSGASCSPSSEDPCSRMSPTRGSSNSPGGFPPLPPPPPGSFYGGHGSVDEGDWLDGPEYEEEEVALPLTAPPTNQWYHGKLDRTMAEERLRQARTPGSYLIRESDRRPGSFVLSFLSVTGAVSHFRIIAMCGDYYIGGRRFTSLSDLIGYYSYVSCLLKEEKLLSPVAPPEPVEDRRRVRAILPYTKVPDTDEISFLKGDMFIVHNELEDGWMWVTNVRTEEQGLIVVDLVKPVVSYDLSSEINRFEISLSNKTKKSKENDILFMCCQLSRLQRGQMSDEWFPLSSHVPLKGIEPGSLRVRARYSMEKIMSEDEYTEFKELILQKDFHVIYALAHVCGQDRTLLASILLKIFRHMKIEALLLRTLNDREISMEDEATTLFRATTLASTLMEQYMKATATPFVLHVLKDTILKIMECKQSCELNPSKLEKNEDVNLNQAHLLNILSELVEKIFSAADILPRTLRFIYGCLQKSVQKKWPQNTTMRTRVVSGFVFLRLICPAILNPRMFNIITDPPSPTAARTLTLVAKSVQNLANLVEFGAKEPYMEGVNPFIKSNKHQMIVFLDTLGNVSDLPDTNEHFRIDLSRDLAALHEICVSHSDELRTLSNERGPQQHILKKLLAITELLQQKQDHYSMPNNTK
ncbi:ras GTPase-activating protein 1-like [Arapaima gigas]